MDRQKRGPRIALATVSLTAWLVASMLQPVAAVEGGDHVAWKIQPATTFAKAVITSVVRDPSGPPIKAALLNGSNEQLRREGIKIVLEALGTCEDGSPADSRLSGNVGWTNSNGVASFSPKIGCEGSGLRLRAWAADTGSETSGNMASDDSVAFDLQGVLTDCSPDCSDTQSQGDTTVEVSATSNGGYLVLDLEYGSLTCGGYTTTSQVAFFDVTSGTARTQVVITLDASEITRSHRQYEICLKKDGTSTLLDDCRRNVGLDDPACVEVRKKEKDGDVRITVSVPPGDPRLAM